MKADIQSVTLTVMIAGFTLMGGMIHYTNTRIDKVDDRIDRMDSRISSIDNRLCRIEGIMSVKDCYASRVIKEEEKNK